MKKIAIVCDDYKLKMFKEELTTGGFTDHTVKPYSKGDKTSLISISTEADKVEMVVKICKKVELHYKRGN